MAETFIVPVKGIGKPDYTREVSSGEIRPGIALKYNQQLMQFVLVPQDIVPVPGPIPWVIDRLAPFPVVTHLFDTNTGVPMPYTVPKGYGLTLFEKSYNLDQDCEFWVYFDTMLFACFIGSEGGSPQHVANVVGISTLMFDPTAALSHLVDIVVINRGGALMRGGAQMVCILEALGTPPFPTTKTTQCPFCGYQQVVPVVSTNIKCSGCGKDYIVWDTTGIKRL